jgi:DNA repair protein RecO (recombination protein O)
MSNRVDLEPAFVLHTRAYRNSSLVVELFTMRHGRMGMMARSARGPRSRYQGNLQLFSPLLVSWTGRSNLKNLGNIELCGLSYQLEGSALLCGFYLNELLMRLMNHEDPYPKIYEYYQTTLNTLEQGGLIEPQLRYFEKNLLNELGYGIPLTHDITSGCEVSAAGFYRYLPERGFVQCENGADTSVFPGSVLLAFHEEALIDQVDLKLIKRLMRFVLARHLGDKPVFSREILSAGVSN